MNWEGSIEALDDLLTRAGLKVESIVHRGADFPRVVVAQILESKPHPNADRLRVCVVDDGSGTPRQIVCGAKNYAVGDKVPLALPGAVLPGDLKIKVGKLRGVESEGMLCSGRELGVAEDAEGLLLLGADAPVGREIGEVLPRDVVIELEITSNRPDWLSHRGVAREIAAFSELALREPAMVAEPSRAEEDGFVRRDHAEGCPFYSVRRIAKVQVGPSPRWLRDRLEAVGLRSINNVVDITNHVMLDTGQPLHAFDAARVRQGIIVRAARDGEAFGALDGREYRLSDADLVIADAAGSLALAGVMGGEASGVTASTTDVLLESALFAPAMVRRTARRLDLHSDSSHRFERGVDPGGVLAASGRAASLIAELCGGEPAETVHVSGSLPDDPPDVLLSFSRCRSLLGVDLSNAQIVGSLGRLGLQRRSADEVGGTWGIPSYRRDLSRPVDLIEEVARMTGIEIVVGRIAAAPAAPSPADAGYDFAMGVRRKLCALGLSEGRTSSLVAGLQPWRGQAAMRLRNPLGEDHAFLRTSLVPGLLQALERNIRHGARSFALFEIGRIFDSTGQEQTSLAIVLHGEAFGGGWRCPSSRMLDWHDAKGIAESLLPGECEIVRCEADGPLGLAAEIHFGGSKLGVLGQLEPSAARELSAAGAVLVIEIDLAKLRRISRLPAFASLPKYPAITRDFAIVCPLELPYAEIAAVLRGTREPLLEGFCPFDVFVDPSGAKLPADRKSLAISLTFRAPERTLNSEEVNAASERLKRQLKEKLAVDFRE